MKHHAAHAIATVDVAFDDLLDDDDLAVDTAVVILAVILGHAPPAHRVELAERLLADAIALMEYVGS